MYLHRCGQPRSKKAHVYWELVEYCHMKRGSHQHGDGSTTHKIDVDSVLILSCEGECNYFYTCTCLYLCLHSDCKCKQPKGT